MPLQGLRLIVLPYPGALPLAKIFYPFGVLKCKQKKGQFTAPKGQNTLTQGIALNVIKLRIYMQRRTVDCERFADIFCLV